MVIFFFFLMIFWSFFRFRGHFLGSKVVLVILEGIWGILVIF